MDVLTSTLQQDVATLDRRFLYLIGDRNNRLPRFIPHHKAHYLVILLLFVRDAMFPKQPLAACASDAEGNIVALIRYIVKV